MAVAKPRQATFFPGRVVPVFLVDRAPLKNDFAAVAAKAIPDTAGLWTDLCCPALSFLNNIQSALAPTAFAVEPA